MTAKFTGFGTLLALCQWHKPLAARLLPVPGRAAGEQTEFSDPFLANTTLHAVP